MRAIESDANGIVSDPVSASGGSITVVVVEPVSESPEVDPSAVGVEAAGAVALGP